MTSANQLAQLEHRLDGREDSPVIVLANGLGTNLEIWEPQAQALSPHFRVLRYNHRGHGASECPPGPYTMAGLGGDLLALLDELGIDRFSIAGVSLGGMVAMWVASEAPERVQALIVLPSAPKLGTAEMWNERARASREEGPPSFAEAVAGRWFTDGFKSEHPEVLAEVIAMVANNPAEGHAGCVEAIRDMDLRAGLSKITADTLVIGATLDPATPPEHAEYISDEIGGSRRVIIHPAAHLVAVEQPDLVSALIAAQLGRVTR